MANSVASLRVYRAATTSAARGFTLVEVVVALAVLSLILLATVSALRTFANTQVSVDRIVARVDEVRTVSSFLRDMLDGAVAGDVQGGGLGLGGGGGGSELAYFEGDSKSLAWKTSAMFGEVYGGTMLLRLVYEGSTLKLYWQDPPPDNQRVVWGEAHSRVLLANVEEFSVGFRPEYGRDWQYSNWDSGKGAPTLVRLAIKASGRHWPDLIMRVQR